MARRRLISELFMPSRRCAVASRMFKARSTAVAVLASFSGTEVLRQVGRRAWPIRLADKFCLCSLPRILVQHTEHNIARPAGFLLQRSMQREQLFSILNTLGGAGSSSPFRGKFIPRGPQTRGADCQEFSAASYLIAGNSFTGY